MIKISKLEAARSQLDTALELLSNKGEPLSIHTLTAASHGILEGLAKRSGIQPIFSKDNPLVAREYKDKFSNIIKKSANFLKHSGKDSKENLDFNSEETIYLLLDAVEMYIRLTNRPSFYMYTFQIWFFLKFPQILRLLDEGKNVELDLIREKIGQLEDVEFFDVIRYLRYSEIK